MATYISVAEAGATLVDSRQQGAQQLPEPQRQTSVTISGRQPSASKVQQRAKSERRHAPTLSWDSLGDIAFALPLTPWHATRHALGQVVLLVTLALKLWTYLGVGYKWTIAFYRLVLYALLLMPGFLQMIVFYYFSPRVIRSVPYGRGPRQRLDMYLPENYSKDQMYPVVIFVTGGAWTIGYKAWGALLARRLSSAGVLVACLDYRNFPQGDAMQMLEDVNTGIGWVCDKCARYQGDPDNVVLVGQSAGGQLAALALLMQAEQAAGRSVLGATPPWSPRDLRAFVGVSGAYDLEGLAEHLHKRGLYKNMFRQIMSIDGVTALDTLSPLRAARALVAGSASAQLLPQFVLIHGTKDNSVPWSSSQQLHDALSRAGVDSTCRLVDGKTHTSFLLEGPMSGGRDLLMDLVLPLLDDSGSSSAVSKVDRALSKGNGMLSEWSNDDSALSKDDCGTSTADGEWSNGGSASSKVDDDCESSSVALSNNLSKVSDRPQIYPALCPTVLCNLASMVCPF